MPPPSPDRSQLDAAVKLHQAGRIEEAAAAYRAILRQSPDDADALHLLGVTHLQTARPGEAAGLIERALSLRPNVAIYHLNLAGAYHALRRIDDTIEHAEKAIALDAANSAARGYFIAGMAFGDDGQLTDAAYCFTKAVEADPAFADAQLMLGVTLGALGGSVPAEDGGAETDERRTSNVEHRTSNEDAAAAATGAARRLAAERIARDPDDADARRLAARVEEHSGNLPAAAEHFRGGARLRPADPTMQYALGQVLDRLGQPAEAQGCYEAALRLNPRYAEAHAAVGTLLDRQHRPAEAAAAFRAALAISPRLGAAQGGLAAALTHQGLIDEAIAAGRRAVELSPGSSSIYSALLLTMHYSDRVTPDELFAEHLEWAKRFAGPLRATANQPHANARDPEKVLRIGFVSADFKKHPVAKVMLPVLEQLDRSRFSVTCYSDVAAGDAVTERFRRATTAGAREEGEPLAWRDVVGWSDDRLARQIRADGIDILVDLAAHTGAADRLLTFARKPAPVQVTHFGYPDTTGLATTDWRITDALSDPPGETERWSTEQLARLPRAAYCYRPFEPQPPIAQRGGGGGESVVFGSVNNLAKLSPATLRTWAALLSAAPSARLAVLATTRDVEQTTRRLAESGIDLARLTVLERTPIDQYFSVFNQFDIALDPFPYNGGVTTCDALWMGMPVVTLAGRTYVSRQGVSLLTHVGLADLIAASPEEYVRIAAQLAGDRPRLAHLRESLRGMMTASPLCDYAGFTRELQDFYRGAWRAWCDGSC